MEDRIMTLHPDGKQGVNINKEKYSLMKNAILDVLEDKKELSFTELGKEVMKKLRGKFEGSIKWYYTTVKLDLEARKIIERIPDTKPQILKLKGKRRRVFVLLFC